MKTSCGEANFNAMNKTYNYILNIDDIDDE